MKYLKTVLLGIIIGGLFGELVCTIVVFIMWDIDIFKQILIPIRIGATFGFVISNVVYFIEKYNI